MTPFCYVYPNASNIFKIFNVYLILKETERQSTSGRGAERERETQNLKQAPDSGLSAQSLT